MNTAELYLQIYNEQSAKDFPRFIVFQPNDRSGWGNRIRALMLCYLFSLCARRILIVKDFLIEEHFLSPEFTNWSMKKWRNVIRARNDIRFMNVKLRPDNFDGVAWTRYCSESLDTIFPESVLIHDEGVTFAEAIVSNPIYQPLLSSIGIDAKRKMGWVGTLAKEILSRPTDKLLRKVDAIARNVKLSENRPVGIQFRTFFDIGSPNLKYVSQFTKNVALELEAEKERAGKRTIFITTDDRDVAERMSKELERFGNVVTSSRKTVHTGGLHIGIQVILERVLMKLLGGSARSIDFFFWLPAHLRPRPHTRVLAEWYLLGECDPIYSTFTSFGIFAAARRGNSSKLLKFDEENGKFVNMVDNIYLF
jgi:hypothetical protein